MIFSRVEHFMILELVRSYILELGIVSQSVSQEIICKGNNLPDIHTHCWLRQAEKGAVQSQWRVQRSPTREAANVFGVINGENNNNNYKNKNNNTNDKNNKLNKNNDSHSADTASQKWFQMRQIRNQMNRE